MNTTAPCHRRPAPAAALALLVGLSIVATADAANASTAPPSPSTLTLRVGSNDADDRPAGQQILEFAEHVADLSDGAITIEPAFNAAEGSANPHWDQAVAERVMSGDLELGLIPTRAWDVLGVTSLRAINTPFLVTREDLVAEVISSDIADELMAGLDAAGVVGLALVPESLRHPFGFDHPLLGPEDYAGLVIRAPESANTAAMFAALGATVNDEPFNLAVQDGAESEYAFDPPGTATGNVTFFPKVSALVVNGDIWAGLDGDQQALIEQAATATRDWAIGEVESDHDAAIARCADGFGVTLAPEDDVARLVDAVAPVVADLREDPVTAGLIDQITAMRDALPPRAADPVICDPTTTDTTPTAASDVASLNGVYQYELTDEAFLDAGITDAFIIGDNHGTYTWTLHDGTFRKEQTADNLLSNGSHISIEDGTYVVDGDEITFSDPLFPPGERFRYNQDAAGNLQLEAVQTDDAIVTVVFVGATWIRIGDGPS